MYHGAQDYFVCWGELAMQKITSRLTSDNTDNHDAIPSEMSTQFLNTELTFHFWNHELETCEYNDKSIRLNLPFNDRKITKPGVIVTYCWESLVLRQIFLQTRNQDCHLVKDILDIECLFS